MKYWSWLLIILLVGCSNAVLGQAETSWSNLKTVRFTNLIAQKGDTLVKDSLTILSASVILEDKKTLQNLAATYYKIDNNAIIWLKNYQTEDLILTYRVLPFDLGAVKYNKDTAWISPTIDGRIVGGYEYKPNGGNDSPFATNGLNYNGTYARGLSFGNNQDATFNSTFNLQMSGNLGDDVEIVAAISDNNIPIQPQGNTQQLQDFDKVFIQIKKKETSLTAGDYELMRPNSYFMNYYKKLQGATFSTKLNLDDDQTLQTKASFAIARGKFAKNTVTAIEGNQGPYRLRGNGGERFIIVLAGTEKVFIDGQLLTRGQNKDYIIDYNRGEVTFTPNQLITKDKRIIIEFEYNDQNYNRTLYALNNTFDFKEKWQFSFNLYSEQDAKTTNTDRELTSAEQDVLRLVTDDVGVGLASGVDSVAFSTDLILYKLVDTLVNGVSYDSVLVYSTNADSGFYAARFLEVGIGLGNYVRLQSAANGTVFGWVAPDAVTGAPSGSFEPIIQLTAPAQRQLYTVGARYKINKKSSISTEIALSHRDLNRLADVNSQTNTGYAAKLTYEHEQQISAKQKITLQSKADYELVQRYFAPLNPFRSREFERDWNVSSEDTTTQHIGKVGFTLNKVGLGSAAYEFGTFLQGETYTGFKQFGVLKMAKNGVEILAQGDFLKTEGITEQTAFFRPKLKIEKAFFYKKKKTETEGNPSEKGQEKENEDGGKEKPSEAERENGALKIGIYSEREQNRRQSIFSDTLSKVSFYYDLVRLYGDWTVSKAANFSANYQRRYDYLPDSNRFSRLTTADEMSVSGNYSYKNNQRLGFNLTYRTLAVNQPTETTVEPQETYLGRLDYSFAAPKGWVRYNANYQIGSGQEQKVQYNYLQVDVGQGYYTWFDRNNDDIKQLDEFELSVFQDQADHIRVVTFTDEYIRTNQVQFNQSFNLDPRAFWRKPDKPHQKLLAKFSVQSNWQILRKVRQIAGVSPWSPFDLNVADSALVSVTSNVRNSVYFNRVSAKFRAEIGQQSNQSRVVLTTGYEDRQRTEWFLKLLYNATKDFTVKWTATTGKNANDSEIFNTRDYAIDFFEFAPELVFQSQTSFRANLQYKYQNSKNTLIDAPETAVFHDISTELTYRQKSKGSVDLRFSFAKVDFSGVANTPLEFAMLQGLKNGQNYSWNLTYRRTLMKNLEMNFTYEGRKTGAIRVVHTGRAGVRAVF